MNTTKARPVCTYCDGHNIGTPADCVWNVEQQAWEIETIFDGYFCCDCESDVSVNWEELA